MNRECGASVLPLLAKRGLEPLGKRRKEWARSDRPARAERAGASESLGRGEEALRVQGKKHSKIGVRCSLFSGVVEQLVPAVGQDDAVAAVGIGPAGEGEAAELAEE